MAKHSVLRIRLRPSLRRALVARWGDEIAAELATRIRAGEEPLVAEQDSDALSLRLDGEVVALADDLAASKGCSRAAILRAYLEDMIEIP